MCSIGHFLAHSRILGRAVGAHGVWLRARLDQVLDSKPFARKSRIHSPYGQLELDSRRPPRSGASRSSRGRGVSPTCSAPGGQQMSRSASAWLNANSPPGAQQARGLRDGPVRIGEGHRPVVAEDDVEAAHPGGAPPRRWRGPAGSRRRPRPSAGERARAGAPTGRARPAGRRAWPARSTIAPRRSRARGRPCRRRRRGRGPRLRGSARRPRRRRGARDPGRDRPGRCPTARSRRPDCAARDRSDPSFA